MSTGERSAEKQREDYEVQVEIEKILDVLISGDQLTQAMEDKFIELIKTIIYSRRTISNGAETLQEKLFKYLSLTENNFLDQILLYEAIKNNNKNKVKDFLEKNFDINSAVTYNHNYYGGLTALGVAVELKLEDIVQLLLDHESCDINAAAESVLTPLHVAALSNNLTIAKKLISKGATIDVYSKYQPIYNSLFFRWAFLQNYVFNESSYFYGIDIVNLTMKQMNGITALQAAVKADKLEMVHLLLDHGADINAHCLDRGEGCTALHYAIKNRNRTMVNFLLSKGARVNARSNNGETVLQLAVTLEEGNIVRSLCFAGADMNCRRDLLDYEDMPPLLEAMSRMCVPAMVALIVSGADLNAIGVLKSSSKLMNFVHFYSLLNNFSQFQNQMRFDIENDMINWSQIYEKVWKHIMKCKVAGFAANPTFLNLANSHQNIYEGFLSECEAQVKQMKEEQIEGTCVCYHDLFFTNVPQMVMYANNKNIEEAMNLPDLISKFPLYAHMLMESFDKGRKRNQLLVKVHENLKDIFINLPDDCVRQILIYLSNDDLLMCLGKK
ncbi:alpha-latrocrustotoxin-Lt1a [Microplitis demolitor]|uniref:alpha-latrocrustotoxin-Lt1a n=1 Tax=Microplitis demolitor TaxID=69319 RepID=UPI0004CCBC8D|nr:alpha-latrocrustotoxin-Lt1a [Microplitis demolitor]XP_053594053.1 alpha-latrocrustotoxin-Lt1a [Microplitis demolitor]